MTTYEVVPATDEHAQTLAGMLRNPGSLDCQMIGMNNLEAIRYGMTFSEASWVGLVDGRPVCIFGAAIPDVLAEEAQLWIFGTLEMAQHTHAFARRNKAYLEYLKGRFHKLYCWVYEDNAPSIRWVEWLGGECLRTETHFGKTFAYYEFWHDHPEEPPCAS